MRQHIQAEHQDILLMRKRSREVSEKKTGSTVGVECGDQVEVCGKRVIVREESTA